MAMQSNTVMPSSGSVIQLDEVDEFPVYVAIYSSQKIENPFVLSPVAMQWSEQIVLNRIEDCEIFWTAQKNRNNCNYKTLFETVLSHHYSDDYIAVFACHPWQCVLYLEYQLQQNSPGVYFLQGLLHQHVYQSLGWPVWFASQQKLADHLESINAKGFNAARFRARQAQLKRFIGRIGLAGPFDLQQADYQSFSRRFETWLARVWHWTVKSDIDLCGFPWIKMQQPDRPAVVRDMEYPVNHWQVVEALLREDLIDLSERLVRDDNEHLNRMSWQVTLFNQQSVDVDLSFRQPYSLHHDYPEFKTALYQARYMYDDLIRDLQMRDKDLDLPETMPLIAWRIEVCERFSLPPMMFDLFGTQSDDMAQEDLLNLQNKLPVNIESYCCSSSFYPEQTFRMKKLGERIVDNEFSQLQWSTQSINRPLFYYQSVQPIENPETYRSEFLERCASDWWQINEPRAVNRDYYLLKGSRGRVSWGYRDFEGRWFKQGEYC